MTRRLFRVHVPWRGQPAAISRSNKGPRRGPSAFLEDAISKKKPAKDPANDKSIIAIGIDETGKPRAARFPMSQRDLVLKATGLMHLDAYEIDNASLGDLFSKIPGGRLYSNGRGFVPYMRRDRYSKLREALGLTPEPAEQDGSTATTPPGLPESWDTIAVGSLVIAQADAASDGWWEALVLDTQDDMLTLKWRDYPKEPKLHRHRSSVALLKPPVEHSSAPSA